MFLAKLPSDLLGQILNNRECSHLVVSLWRCGDRILQEKLASSISYVHLVAFKNAKFGFPRMLTHLRKLTYLSVESQHKLMKNPADWSNTLSKLPKSLETLRIVGDEDYCPLLNFAPEWTESEPLYFRTECKRGPSLLIDMETLFPALRTLKIDRLSRPYLSDIPSSDLPGLPSSLTCLDVKLYLDHRRIPEHSPLLLLPRSLKRLEGVFGATPSHASKSATFQQDWLENAPPQLECILKLDGLHPSIVHWWIPSSLTELGVSGAPPIWSNFYAEHWPSNVQSLSITVKEDRLTSKYTSLLPRNLTQLAIRPHSALVQFAPSELPPTLKKLTITQPGLHWHYINIISMPLPSDAHWPAELEEFDCGSIMPSKMIPYLPRSLKRLSMTLFEPKQYISIGPYHPTHDSTASAAISDLPPNLTDLRLRIELNAATYDGEPRVTSFSHNLPETLANLTLVRTGSQQKISFWKNESIVNYGLPSGLTSLSANDFIFEEAGGFGSTPDVQLSPTLTSLELLEWNFENFGILPRTLLWFRLTLLKGFKTYSSAQTSASASRPSPPCVISNGALFESLPPRLTSFIALTIEPVPRKSSSGDSSEEDDGILIDLPLQRLRNSLPDLHTFHFPRALSLPSNFLRVLPPLLRSLEVNLKDFDIYDAPFIPQYLTNCALGKSFLSLDQAIIVSHWPPKCADLAPAVFRKLISQRLSEL